MLKVSAGASKEGLISRVGRVGAMNRIKHKRWPPQWAECCYSRVSAGSAAIVPLIVGIQSTHCDHEIGNHVHFHHSHNHFTFSTQAFKQHVDVLTKLFESVLHITLLSINVSNSRDFNTYSIKEFAGSLFATHHIQTHPEA